jgi:glycosyltransferase involved in cell wall biosynthesis
LANAPTVSIVVASVSARAALEACIETLLPVCTGASIELVVVRSTSPEEFRELQNRYRAALFMPAPDGSSVRILRNFGIAAADGDIVAFMDDTQPPDSEWLGHIVALTAPASTS